MKHLAVALGMVLIFATAFGGEKIVLNYSQNRQDFIRVVMDVNMVCMNANSKTLVKLEGGILSQRSTDGLRDKTLFDFLDRWLLANYDHLEPMVIEMNGMHTKINGVGGPAHIDYPNEVELTIEGIDGGPALIQATIKSNYTSESKSYSWQCNKMLISVD